MALTALVREPAYPLLGVLEQHAALQARYIRLEADGTDIRCAHVESADLLSRSAALLELTLAAACITEAAEGERDANGDLDDHSAHRVLQTARTTSHLNLGEVIHAAIKLFGIEPAAERVKLVPIATFVRLVRTIVAACPIEALEHCALSIGAEALGYRCRTAYDGVQAFLRRQDPIARAQVGAIGRAYAAGALTLRDVADALRIGAPDAVAELESCGFSRELVTIRLSDSERQRRFESLRNDRVARREASANSIRSSVDRDVIASERIEGVDARRWLREAPVGVEIE